MSYCQAPKQTSNQSEYHDFNGHQHHKTGGARRRDDRRRADTDNGGAGVTDADFQESNYSQSKNKFGGFGGANKGKGAYHPKTAPDFQNGGLSKENEDFSVLHKKGSNRKENFSYGNDREAEMEAAHNQIKERPAGDNKCGRRSPLDKAIQGKKRDF